MNKEEDDLKIERFFNLSNELENYCGHKDHLKQFHNGLGWVIYCDNCGMGKISKLNN